MDRPHAPWPTERGVHPTPEPEVRLGNRYALGEVIGRGATADVVRAHDELLRRDVAVKTFHRDSMADESRQHSEIEILSNLNHRGLVTVFDRGTDGSSRTDPRSYLVMELIDGQSLSELLRTGPRNPRESAGIGAQLACALDYIHGKGIVHRDVKPANVLLAGIRGRAGDWQVKLTDFGIARHVDSARMTVAGTTVGTAHYLSPEQALGGDVTGASDMYSLGLLLLECLTGQRAYPGPGIEAVIARLDRDPDIPDRFGPEWTRLLIALTARSPLDRPFAADAHRSLQRLADAPPATILSRSANSSAALGVPLATCLLPAEREHSRRWSPARAIRALVWGAVVAGAVTLLVGFMRFGGDTAGRPTSPPGVSRPTQRPTGSATAQATSSVLPPQPPGAPQSPASVAPVNARPTVAAVNSQARMPGEPTEGQSHAGSYSPSRGRSPCRLRAATTRRRHAAWMVHCGRLR